MNRRTTSVMVIAVLCGFSVIILMNIASLFGFIPSKYIAPNDVRGMAVEHNGLLYTLNFQQQNHLVEIFNRSNPISGPDLSKRKITPQNAPDVKKIIIYRFNAPDIEITPVAYTSRKETPNHAALVFTSSEWNHGGYLEESIPEQSNEVLLTTYDK